MMTDAELTILSLVAEGPRFGYEIQQVIDERGLREWVVVGFSSIYYILNKLEKQDMLTSELRSDGRNPANKVYQITEAGRGVLQTAISDLLRQPRSLGTGFELGLANLHVLKPHQVFKVLSYHRTELMQRLEAVERSWERHQKEDTPDVADHIRALYTHSIALMRSELDWLNKFIDEWKQRYPAVEDRPDSQVRRIELNPNVTQVGRRTLPEPAKMIQRLRRPGKPREE
jgi:DNA-binding PadR family transcriptional regulator